MGRWGCRQFKKRIRGGQSCLGVYLYLFTHSRQKLKNAITGEGGWIKSLLECRPFTVTSRLTVRAHTLDALPEPYQRALGRIRCFPSQHGVSRPTNPQHHVLPSLPPTILNQHLKQYCAYLIHPAVIFWVYGDHLGPIHYSTVWCVRPACVCVSLSLSLDVVVYVIYIK